MGYARKAAAVTPGEVANVYGDLFVRRGFILQEGRIAVSIFHAIKAIPYGWRWMGSDGRVVFMARGIDGQDQG
jgi:hypothetical protein